MKRLGCVVLLLLLTAAAQGQLPATTTTLTSNSGSLQLPGSLTLHATVAPAGAGRPTGSLTFDRDGSNSLGSAALATLPATEKFSAPGISGTFGNLPFGLFSLPPAAGSNDNRLGMLDYAYIAATNSVNPQLTIFSGHGAALFQNPTANQITNSGFSAYDSITGNVVADFNHDGVPDVLLYGYPFVQVVGVAFRGALQAHPAVVTGSNGNEIYVLPGKSDGTFDQTAAIFSPDNSGINCDCTYPSAALAVDDFNGDGYPDLAYAANGAYSNNLVGVSLNAGSAAPGSFQTFITAPAPVPPPTLPNDTFQTQTIASGHFTSSGHTDLVVAGQIIDANFAVVDSGDLAIYLGNGDGTFATPTLIQGEGLFPVALATADFRKNGKTDIVVANQGSETGPASVVVLFGDGAGNFATSSTVNLTTAPRTVNVADLNQDGYPDLVISDTNGALSVLLNDGTGHFSTLTAIGTALQYSSMVAVGDFNGDSLGDIAQVTTTSLTSGTSSAQELLNSASAEATLTTAAQSLPAGAHTLTATFPGDVNLAASTSAGVAVTVTQSVPTISWPTPAAIQYGTPLSATQLNATASVPGSFTYSPAAGTVLPVGNSTVTAVFAPTDSFDYSGARATQTVNVVAGTASVQISAPTTVTAGQNASITLSVSPYAAPITATLTLSFTPDPPNTVTDPAVLFPNNSNVEIIQIPANSSAAIPPIAFSPGSTAGKITVTLHLVSGGVDITPASLTPAVITVPPTAPAINSVKLTRTGTQLTVAIIGLSSTREMTQAHFHFTAAAGHSLTTTDLTVTVNTEFGAWYGSADSANFGTMFLYTQPFTLDSDASSVGSVTVTLTNSQGASQPATAQ